jgi:hypothetical protein
MRLTSELDSSFALRRAQEDHLEEKAVSDKCIVLWDVASLYRPTKSGEETRKRGSVCSSSLGKRAPPSSCPLACPP